MTIRRRISMFDIRGSARVRIEDGEIVGGKVPPTVARILKEWTALRRDALMRNWQAARTDGTMEKIAGLEL